MNSVSKYINLNPQDRFVDADLLRNSYLRYSESLNFNAPTYIDFKSEDLELGIISSQIPEMARAVSSILTCSLEDAKTTKGGYIPPDVVERIQLDVISPFGVAYLWGVTGHRFIISRSAEAGKREIIASALIGRSKDTIFFLTGRCNNLRHSTIKQAVDLNQPDGSDPNQKWFDRFAFPDLDRFKPARYHQIANFVVAKYCRRQGLAKFMIENVVRYYSRDHIAQHQNEIEHSQYLLCGRGLWQIGDPPWLPKMKALGFYLRGGAESFFIEHDWAKLPEVMNKGKRVSNVEYNQSFGMPQIYENFEPSVLTDEHMMDRIPEVVKLAQDPRAKLQYYQAMYNFL